MPRIRRDLELAHNTAVAAGGTTPYDHLRPWNSVFREVLKDGVWWRAELEEPALFYNARCQALGHLVAGDAPVAPLAPTQAFPAQLSIEGPSNRGGPPQPKNNKTGREEPRHRVHSVSNDGQRYLENRKGSKLCAEFQTGA